MKKTLKKLFVFGLSMLLILSFVAGCTPATNIGGSETTDGITTDAGGDTTPGHTTPGNDGSNDTTGGNSIPDDPITGDGIEDDHYETISTPTIKPEEVMEVFRPIGDVGCIYDFSNVGAVNGYINDNKIATNVDLGVRSTQYGGPALQVQSWGTKNPYITFVGSGAVRKDYPWVKIVYDVQTMSDGSWDILLGEIKSGSYTSGTGVTAVSKNDIVMRKYVPSVVKIDPNVNQDVSLLIESSTRGYCINVKYIAFFDTEEHARAFDESIYEATFAGKACTVDQITKTITISLPDNMSAAELKDLQISDLELTLYNSQSDYSRALANGYKYDHRCRILSSSNSFTVNGRQATAEVVVTNVDCQEITWKIVASSAGAEPVNNSNVKEVSSGGRYATIDVANKKIIFKGGDIGAITYTVADGVSVKEGDICKIDGGYTKTVTVGAETWTVTMPNKISLEVEQGDNSIEASFKNAPTGSTCIIEFIDDNGKVTNEVRSNVADNIPIGEYKARIRLYGNGDKKTVLYQRTIEGVSYLFTNGKYDTKNDRGNEWVGVPFVSQTQLDKGVIGGEGGQVNTWIELSTDGKLMLMFEDVGAVYKSTDKGQTWISTARDSGPGLEFGVIDPYNNNRVIAATTPSNQNNLNNGYKKYGLYLSTDGADSFKHVLAYADPVQVRTYTAIAFDPSSYDSTIDGCKVVYFSTPSTAGANSGAGLYKSTDGGSTWKLVNDKMARAEIAVDNEGILYAAKSGVLYKSLDGITFVEVPDINVDKICIVKDTVYVVGDKGVSYCSDGENFITAENRGFVNVPNNAHPSDFKVSPVDPNYMMYGYQEAELYKERAYYTNDGGKTWHLSAYNGEFDFYDKQARQYIFEFDNEDSKVVYSTADWPIKSTNGGKSFRAIPNGVNGTCIATDWTPNVYNKDFWFVPAQDFSGAITLDGGKTFISLDSIDTSHIISHVYGGYVVDENTYFCLATNDWGSRLTSDNPRQLLMTTDGGNTWIVKGELNKSLNYTDWYCNQSTKNPKLLFAGNLMSSDGGETWASMPEHIGKVFGSDSKTGRLFAKGFGSTNELSTVYYSDDEGKTWSKLFTAKTINGYSYPGLQYFSARYDEKLECIYYTTYGILYKYDIKSETHTSYEQQMRAATGGLVLSFATAFAIDPNDSNVLYLGVMGSTGVQNRNINDKDTILRSCDGGKTWQVISGNSMLRSVVKTGPAVSTHECKSLFVDDDGYVYASLECSGMYKFAPPYTVK